MVGDRGGTRDSLILPPVNFVSSVIMQMNLHVYFLTRPSFYFPFFLNEKAHQSFIIHS